MYTANVQGERNNCAFGNFRRISPCVVGNLYGRILVVSVGNQTVSLLVEKFGFKSGTVYTDQIFVVKRMCKT